MTTEFVTQTLMILAPLRLSLREAFLGPDGMSGVLAGPAGVFMGEFLGRVPSDALLSDDDYCRLSHALRDAGWMPLDQGLTDEEGFLVLTPESVTEAMETFGKNAHWASALVDAPFSTGSTQSD
jgi:hypothetical protein